MKKGSKTNAAAVLALLIAVAGCSGASSGASERQTLPREPVTTTPTTPTATVAQYASVVSSQAPGLRKSSRQLENCLTPTQLCALLGKTASVEADTLQVALTGSIVDSPGDKGYLGIPPSEILGLVRSTLDDAVAVHRVGASEKVLLTPAGLEKLKARLGILISDIDGWRPYGV